jgi:hypothetical protein
MNVYLTNTDHLTGQHAAEPSLGWLLPYSRNSFFKGKQKFITVLTEDNPQLNELSF